MVEYFICPNLPCRNLMVIAPVTDHNKTECLKKKSQEKLWDLLKQGNPQDVIPYAMALTSQLNQVGFASLNLNRFGQVFIR